MYFDSEVSLGLMEKSKNVIQTQFEEFIKVKKYMLREKKIERVPLGGIIRQPRRVFKEFFFFDAD